MQANKKNERWPLTTYGDEDGLVIGSSQETSAQDASCYKKVSYYDKYRDECKTTIHGEKT